MELDIEETERNGTVIVHLVEESHAGTTERAPATLEVDAEWVESHNAAEIRSTLRAMGRELYDTPTEATDGL